MTVPTLGHRLYDQSLAGRETANGVEADVLHWLVRANTSKAALAYQGQLMDDGTILPTAGDPHPDFGYQVRAASVEAVEIGGSGADTFVKVRVNYTPEGNSFSGTPPDVTSPTYTSVSGGVKRIDITVPTFGLSFEYVQVQLSPPPSAPVVRKAGFWIQYDRTITVQGMQYIRDVTVDTFDIGTANAIRAQAGKIHTLGGQQWLFEGASWRQVTTQTWTISYQWLMDPGNGLIDFPTPAGALEVITPSTVRLPFQQYVIHLVETNDPSPIPGDIATDRLLPVVIASDFAVHDAGGWASLPGIGANP